MSLTKVLHDLRTKKGKSGGWPQYFDYLATESEVVIRLTDLSKSRKKRLRGIDPWGFAFLDHLIENVNFKPETLRFDIAQELKSYELESLLRRVSYLANINQSLGIELFYDNKSQPLISVDEIKNKNSSEIIRSEIGSRSADDKAGRIEKDFQTFLFGKGLDSETQTNERLAVLGLDFYKLNNKNFWIYREYPTGAFHGDSQSNKLKDSDRILPTEFIDVVTLNKNRELAVIELKVNDPALEVISQTLNYGLFFLAYKDQILDQLNRYLDSKSQDSFLKRNVPVICYVVNNHFHPRFEGILKYYKDPKRDIRIKVITLGHVNEVS